MLEPEGFLRVTGYKMFYRTFGNPGNGPWIVGLHGGPGACHDYLLPFADLVRSGYRLVLFDQLGCGRSEVPEDTSCFSLAHHVEEVEGLRSTLGTDRVHLIGSSYGGLLALAYALQHQDHLRSMVTVGGLASVPLAQEEMNRLREALPPETVALMQRHERLGHFQHPDYLASVEMFYRRHVCRMDPWPPELIYTFQQAASHPVYAHMNGPNEFTISGTIRDIDLSSDLPRIRVPTLVLGGRFDEVTPRVAQQIHDGIPGSRLVIFENSSHLSFWEERDLFMATVSNFLRSVDRQLPS